MKKGQLRGGALFLAVVSFLFPGPILAATLTVSPAVSLYDQPVSISIRGAAPNSSLTIEATTSLYGNPASSQAAFKVSQDGTVLLDRDPSVSGSYLGIDPMGLFWSLKVTGPFRDVPFDPLAPMTVDLTVRNGRDVLRQTISRLALEPGLIRADVREGGVYGTSFMHSGTQRRAAVIVLGGSEGGIPELEAAVVASHGLDALALAYFGAGTLPKALANIPVEDVQRAVEWLGRQPSVDGAAIGIVGGSKGAELALLSASLFPQIRAVVAEKPSSVVFSGLFYGKGPTQSSWTFRGAPLPYVNGKVPAAVSLQEESDSKAKRPVSYTPEFMAEIQNATNAAAATIPVEQINGPILLVSGDDDALWPSSFMAGQIMSLLRSHGHSFADKWLHYAQAGHGIGIAYADYEHSTGNMFLSLGGTAEANAKASDDSWPQVIAFLQLALGRTH